jgi:hypothetical protein
MSYPRGADVGVAGTGGGSIGSASLVATLANYITSNSVSAMIVTGIGDRPTSNSISIQITSRLTTYMTSGSLLTALTPYLTSASAALSTYMTSGSLLTALTPYLTSASAAGVYIISNSVSIMIAAVALTSNSASAMIVTAIGDRPTSNSVSIMIAAAGGGGLTSNSASIMIAAYAITSNSASAMIVTQINATTLDRIANVVLTAPADGEVLKYSAGNWINGTDNSGGAAATLTASVIVVTDSLKFGTRPGGTAMLGSASGATQAGNGAMNFSGSWSDYGVFVIDCGWRQLGNSGTMSVNVYTDGGTTPFLSIATLQTASVTTNIAQIKVFGGGGAWYLHVQYYNNTIAAKTHATSTLNTGIVNCIRVAINNATATASNIAAFLTGFRKA